ncbi:MAG: Holliday junction DNA helicase RuvA [Candidatus Liptonbacteria bacterium RIFCSPLOWO2_01_FULL_53_13]|uniref:Holliday junction branch migration complex subunit RuvA n=1 Tax=Candidatus Liptonbacteria bacterium RIFCSPLOWO2_01_FULL_53_13 TaxID=1798651 RepID=A0A1G2CLB5_9BACT|nr:MAG: Holliday junction DNA helicase RuvA [Candidatus Liptonbacteria bacterium RIFCSPLOWO2_01_FULL_53_13]
MVYSVSGIIAEKTEHFAVVEVSGLGLKVAMSERALAKLPPKGEKCKLFTHLHVREDALDLYGFESEDMLRFFEMLISVSGVGPKSALSVLDVAELGAILAAVKEGRPDLLTRASGVGRKTAERIVLELRSKVEAKESAEIVGNMESNVDLEETLVNLGYRRDQAKLALERVDKNITKIEERLRAALAMLGRKR